MSISTDGVSGQIDLLSAVSATRRVMDLLVLAIGTSSGAGIASYAAYRRMIADGAVGELVWLVSALIGWALLLWTAIIVFTRFTDEASTGEARPLATSALAAAITLPKVVLALVLVLLAYLLAWLPAWLLMLLVRLPEIGSWLGVVIIPVVALSLGLGFYVLAFLAMPLAICALSQGKTVFSTLALLIAIVRSRLSELVLQTTLLTLVVSIVATILIVIATLGLSVTSMLYSSMSDNSDYYRFGNEMGGLGALLGPAADLMDQLTAMGPGSGSVIAVGITASALVMIKGLAQIYVHHEALTDAGEEEAVLRRGYAQARQRAQELREKAETKARDLQAQAQERARQREGRSSSHSSSLSSATAQPNTFACSNCNSPTAAGDQFCGRCGARCT